MENILLIEDNQNDFENYQASYQELGYKVFPNTYEELYNCQSSKEFYKSIKKSIIFNNISCISIDLNFRLFSNLEYKDSLDITHIKTGIKFIQKLSQDNTLKVRTLPIIVLSQIEQNKIEDYSSVKEIVSIYIEKKNILSSVMGSNKLQLRNYMQRNRIDFSLESAIKAYHKFNYISYNHMFDEDKTYEDMNKTKNEILGSLEVGSDNEIIPFFQSIVDPTQKVIKYEVLANIGQERNSFLKYNNIARFYGLLHYITKAMIQKSFKKMKNNTDIELSINVDYDDLINDDIDDFSVDNIEISKEELKNLPLKHFKNSKFFEFISFLNQEVHNNGLRPEQITLEILEATKQNKYIDIAIGHLKQAGYRIAIDDFGIENSNFIRLKNQLEETSKLGRNNGSIDYIKIDAEFIRGISKSKVLQSIVGSIIDFAKMNNIKTVVEHIDNHDDFSYCRSIEVDLFQGYLFDEPTLLAI